MDEQVAHLEELVAIDVEIRGLTEQIEKARADIEGAQTELRSVQQRLGADRASVAEMDKTRLDLVQELRQMDKQIARSRERLLRARNERESNAAERELDELRKLQRDRDEEVKKLVGLTDQARATIQACEQRESELMGLLDGSLDGVARNIVELESTLEQRNAARKDALARVPNPVARRYEFIRKRRDIVPTARTQDGICGGCHIQLPPMMFHEMLARSHFTECPNCHRIIYYVPPTRGGDPGAAES